MHNIHNIHIHVHVHVYIYMYMYTYMYKYMYIYIYMYTYMSTCTYTCLHIHIHVCIYIYMSTYKTLRYITLNCITLIRMYMEVFCNFQCTRCTWKMDCWSWCRLWEICDRVFPIEMEDFNIGKWEAMENPWKSDNYEMSWISHIYSS